MGPQFYARANSFHWGGGKKQACGGHIWNQSQTRPGAGRASVPLGTWATWSVPATAEVALPSRSEGCLWVGDTRLRDGSALRTRAWGPCVGRGCGGCRVRSWLLSPPWGLAGGALGIQGGSALHLGVRDKGGQWGGQVGTSLGSLR